MYYFYCCLIYILILIFVNILSIIDRINQLVNWLEYVNKLSVNLLTDNLVVNIIR